MIDCRFLKFIFQGFSHASGCCWDTWSCQMMSSWVSLLIPKWAVILGFNRDRFHEGIHHLLLPWLREWIMRPSLPCWKPQLYECSTMHPVNLHRSCRCSMKSHSSVRLSLKWRQSWPWPRQCTLSKPVFFPWVLHVGMNVNPVSSRPLMAPLPLPFLAMLSSSCSSFC